ncbi:MAG: nitronate monooxygenase [Renibacterium salmoninarum]|nr:nitronate monooxygenase [Renibacterium salmoninarum]
MFSSSIIVAPMAGGPSTPELVIAAGQAGQLGFLAGGYKTAEALAGQLDRLAGSGVPFGVNLFVPDPRPVDEQAVRGYREKLRHEAARYGIRLPELATEPDSDAWSAKMDLLFQQPVPFASFAFGLPSAAEARRLRSLGTEVIASVTTPVEAGAAAAAGATALIVQHANAGGHSAAFLDLDAEPGKAPLGELLAAVRQVSKLPLVAAGGIADAAGVAAALDAGASAAQLGTAFLLADEAGTRAVHRAALAGGEYPETARTRAFSGRWARGLANRFLLEHRDAPNGYPQIHHLTSPIRAAAAAAGDPDGVNLWAGTGFAKTSSGSTSEIIARLSGSSGGPSR